MMLEQLRHTVGWIYRLRSVYLFASLILFVMLTPFLEHADEVHEKVVANLLNMFVLVAAVAAVGRTRKSFVFALLLTLPVMGFQLAGLLHENRQYLLWSWFFGATFYFATLMFLLRYVFSSDVMNADKLFGAAAAYMLLGIMWAYFYMISQHFHVGTFTLYGSPVPAMSPQELIYFSFTTLTTAGFGDIAPLHPGTRALVNLEQICGTLFVAILIARLAGIYPETSKNSQG